MRDLEAIKEQQAASGTGDAFDISDEDEEYVALDKEIKLEELKDDAEYSPDPDTAHRVEV